MAEIPNCLIILYGSLPYGIAAKTVKQFVGQIIMYTYGVL
jgi:hypothetical protein